MSGPVQLTAEGGRPAAVLQGSDGMPAEHSPRPFLHPVLTPGGLPISDDAPADHPWHHGLSVAVSTIDVAGQTHPVNLWGGPTFLAGQGYVQLPNNGAQRELTTSAVPGHISQELTWCAADGTAVLAERRTWRADVVRAGGVDWTRITVRSSWSSPGAGSLTFGSPTTAGRPDAGYGGLFLRLSADFDGCEVVAPPEVEGGSHGADGADATADNARAGRPRGSRVVPEGEAMGMLLPWLALRCGRATVLMAAGSRDAVAPTPWFVRSAGTPMLCAAPFFHEVMTLEPGQDLEWTWSLLVADGAAPEESLAAAALAAHAG